MLGGIGLRFNPHLQLAASLRLMERGLVHPVPKADGGVGPHVHGSDVRTAAVHHVIVVEPDVADDIGVGADLAGDGSNQIGPTGTMPP